MIHVVAMQVGAVAAAARGDAIGEHLDDFVEFFAREIAIGIRAAHEREQIVFAPVFRGARCHDLLGENIERRFGNFDAIEFAVTNGAHERGAFEQFIARGGEKAAFGNGAAPVAGASDALQRNGRSSAASRSGRPGRPCRYRCQVRAKPWRRARAVHRP